MNHYHLGYVETWAGHSWKKHFFPEFNLASCLLCSKILVFHTVPHTANACTWGPTYTDSNHHVCYCAYFVVVNKKMIYIEPIFVFVGAILHSMVFGVALQESVFCWSFPQTVHLPILQYYSFYHIYCQGCWREATNMVLDIFINGRLNDFSVTLKEGGISCISSWRQPGSISQNPRVIHTEERPCSKNNNQCIMHPCFTQVIY